MNTIVISHRRQDSRDAARMLFERLLHYFPGRVVLGLEGLLPGENVRLKADQQLQDCSLLLVLISPDWPHLADDRGPPRLHDRRDWVRFEIAQALARGIPVLPVLLGRAAMPHVEDLPVELHGLLEAVPHRLDLGAGRTASLVSLVGAIREQLGETDELLTLAMGTLSAAPLLTEPASVPEAAQDWPLWAVDCGQDGFGGWAEIEVLGVRQRLRRIPPGMFLMGADPSRRIASMTRCRAMRSR
jgi:hypothetical protein